MWTVEVWDYKSKSWTKGPGDLTEKEAEQIVRISGNRVVTRATKGEGHVMMVYPFRGFHKVRPLD